MNITDASRIKISGMITDISIQTRQFGNLANIFECSALPINKQQAIEYIQEMEAKYLTAKQLVDEFLSTEFTDSCFDIAKNRCKADLEYMERHINLRKIEYNIT